MTDENDELQAALARKFPALGDRLTGLIAALEAGESPVFLAHFRRDLLGDLDDASFRRLRLVWREERELVRRRAATRRALASAGRLTDPLARSVAETRDLVLLEDLIRPIREARRGRSTTEDPMAAVAEAILAASPQSADSGAVLPTVEELLAPFCGPDGAHPTAADQRERLLGLVAQGLAHDAFLRRQVRRALRKGSVLVTAPAPGRELKPHLKPVAELSQPLANVDARRLLLVRRGKKAGLLDVHLEPAAEARAALLAGPLACDPANPYADLVQAASEKALDLLVHDASNELINERKRSLERGIVARFADSLRTGLMAPPAGSVPVVAVVPGTGGTVRIVAVDADGRAGRTETVRPGGAEEAGAEALRTLTEIVAESGAKLVAVAASGRAAAAREWVAGALAATPELGASPVPVHEAASQRFAGTDAAKADAPDLPVSARMALGLARRVQDPLRELTCYDLTDIPLGPNQRDVDQGELRRALDEVATECLAAVGVDVNTASARVMARLPGLDEASAAAIETHRLTHGPFRSRKDIRVVEGLSEDAWQRAAGFLRVSGGADALDATGAHPTGLPIARAAAERLGVEVTGLLGQRDALRGLDFAEIAGDVHSVDDVDAVLRALAFAGRDPRGEFVPPVHNSGVRRLTDLTEGSDVEGVVTGLSKFGAFVDIGLRENGLVHVSELAHGFVAEPSDVVTVGDRVRARVLSVDAEKRRISLSMKALLAPPPEQERAPFEQGGGDPRRGAADRRGAAGPLGARSPRGPAGPSGPGGPRGPRGPGAAGGPGGSRGTRGPGGPGHPGGPGGARGGGGRRPDRGGRDDRGRPGDRRPRGPSQVPPMRDVPREHDPFHMQLAALSQQLGFVAPPAPERAKQRPPRKKKQQQAAAPAAPEAVTPEAVARPEQVVPEQVVPEIVASDAAAPSPGEASRATRASAEAEPERVTPDAPQTGVAAGSAAGPAVEPEPAAEGEERAPAADRPS